MAIRVRRTTSISAYVRFHLMVHGVVDGPSESERRGEGGKNRLHGRKAARGKATKMKLRTEVLISGLEAKITLNMRTLIIAVLLVMAINASRCSVSDAIKTGNRRVHDHLNVRVGRKRTSKLADLLCSFYDTRQDSVFNVFKCGVDEPVDVNENNGTQTNKPVILVPGLGGSALDADISFDKSRASILCPKKKRFHIWFSVLEVFNQRCQFEELTLPYNDTTKMFSSTHPGIKINPLDFGGVRGIDYLERVRGVPISLTSYMSRVVKSFEAAGYTPGKDLRGAPYDFRLSPTKSDETGSDFFTKLRSLIEETYEMNDKRKLILIGHSMGCIEVLHLLYSMSDEWKSKYIDSFIPIAGPWIGSPKSLRAVLLGTDFSVNFMGISILKKSLVQRAARTFPGILWMMPFADQRWENSVVVELLNESLVYSPSNITSLLEEVGLHETAEALIHIRKEQQKSLTKWDQFEHMRGDGEIVHFLPPPGVPVTCIYGSGTPTESKYVFTSLDKIKPGKNPTKIEYEDGDGTVTERSLRACEEWIHVNAESGPINQFEYPQGEEIRTTHGKDTSGHRVSIKVYKDADHSGILSVPALIADLIKQATASDQITLQ